MGDDLYRSPQVFAPAFFPNYVFVNLSSGKIVDLAHGGFQKPLVMAQIEIGFRSVLGDKHLSVLERAHRPRIDVDVRIKFGHADFKPACFKDGSQG